MAPIDPMDRTVQMHISKAIGNVSDDILIVDDAVEALTSGGRPQVITKGLITHAWTSERV